MTRNMLPKGHFYRAAFAFKFPALLRLINDKHNFDMKLWPHYLKHDVILLRDTHILLSMVKLESGKPSSWQILPFTFIRLHLL